MRILLFLATNMAVLVLVSTVFKLLGLEGILAANGVDLNLGPLLIFCALFGFGGSLISWFISKWMAKRGTGTRIIEQPSNQQEKWLVDTVRELAEEAGRGGCCRGCRCDDRGEPQGGSDRTRCSHGRCLYHDVCGGCFAA